MTNNRQNELFSETRLESYNNNLNQHYDNLMLVGKITPKIATLEVILRNKLDNVLQSESSDWILKSNDSKVIKARKKIEAISREEIFSHHQYLSRMSLGVITHIIRKNELQNAVMNLKNIKFKDYDDNNKDTFIFKGRKCHFANSFKVDIVLSLLGNLRNRSYHWENILKTKQKNGIAFPRITTKIENAYIGIYPNKIEIFLDDLIRTYDKELLKFCKFRILKSVNLQLKSGR